MSDGQQLERSVLEGKERDELHAIADAMGLKPTSRTAKATLVTKILHAAGIEDTGENGAKKSARTPRAKAAANGDAATATAAQPEPDAPAPVAGERDDAADARDTTADASDGDGDGAETLEQRGPRPQQQGNQQQPRRFDGPGEPGNRRNRRRRGRDRGQGGPGQGGGGGGGERGERDLQGGGQQEQYQGEPIPVAGLLDLRDEGYGFLRTNGYLASPKDVYVSISQVRRFALRKGDQIEGASRPAGSNEKYPALLRIDTVSGMTPDEARARVRFEDLTPLFPDAKLNLEVPGDTANMTARIVDLISPIGKGQRGLIVSPPKAGKTTVLKQIAHSIEANNPDVHLMVLLVDERPEEVTDMRRSVKGEVVSSTFDRPSDEHTAVAELAIERAKRLVELGRDVVIVLDGITRLARAYNLAAPASGRILSGGVDSAALYPPKKFFGSARNIEEGGSLTILATALVETGSRMDEVIFEEFKGTGNMELRLDRRLAERRIYPALDVNASSTRHEELLFDRSQLQQVWKLRRVLNALGSEGSGAAGLELLMDKIKHTKSNDEFLAEIAKGPTPPV
ncbi:MAG: transcription termination factor Rho [Actinomycetota bacterium]|jgi:transcription termination factor Rho